MTRTVGVIFLLVCLFSVLEVFKEIGDRVVLCAVSHDDAPVTFVFFIALLWLTGRVFFTTLTATVAI